MKRILPIVVSILFQLLVASATAQKNDFIFHLVESPDGKQLDKINGITQDRHGFMWFAGNGAKCLYRYDGNRMIRFQHDESNPNSLGITNPEAVYADHNGLIWVGSEGLDEYDPPTGIFKHYRHADNDIGSLGAHMGGVIFEDKKRRLWVGGGSGLDLLDRKTGKFTHYRNIPGDETSLSNNEVRAIYEDHQGVLWIGTGFPFARDEQGGLNRMNADGTFTRYLHDPNNPHSLVSNKVISIFEDSRGVFWVGTRGDGLHTMDRKTGSFERHPYNPAKPDELSRPPIKNGADHINFINEDKTGAIWIGTYGAGLARYDTLTKKITHFQLGNGFPDSTCWTGFISNDGVLWIATENSNLLFKADPFRRSIISITTGNPTLSFIEDEQGSLWAGTAGGGVFKFDQHHNLIQHFRHDPLDSLSLPGDDAVLFKTPGDTIWLRTIKSVRIFDKSIQKFS
ncbi:MAG: two-component regulator propeller domain-containing protein, partial [Saprospiraceae bacterium]